ncbi:MAG: MoxR family ATPase [Candidatus Lokiarchaeota archaeon]|nr:MoxR family ATPase [Candidatus Lokiarchaeota archaeon]
MKCCTIDEVELFLANPDEIEVEWIGQQDALNQLIASWLKVDENDIPLNPRILGKPGVGKTTLAYCAGKKLNKNVYIFQATMDTRPEDLIITPVIGEANQIKYHASSLVTAMIEGGVCVLDEGNRMPEKSWASIAPLLDNRRYVESIIAGIKVKAHPEFRFVTTMNSDASVYEIPEYIHSRLQPQITITWPTSKEEFNILKFNLPFSSKDILNLIVDFLQNAHASDQPYTVRDGINIARYMLKLEVQNKKLSYELKKQAFTQVLGDNCLEFWNEYRYE